MKGLFRSFEVHDLEYLLIGGQAAVLYGAAHFTSDVDVWIRPTRVNLIRLTASLEATGAFLHKLTPPLSMRWLDRGHGFHFRVPVGRSRADDLYLDVMGRPPRVTSFQAAARRAVSMDTPWGSLPVVGIEDLVELKKTNRPGDYEVISRLVRIRLAQLECPGAQELVWALRNSFRAEDLLAVVKNVPVRPGSGCGLQERVIHSLALAVIAGASPMSELETSLDLRLVSHLTAGRAYWTPRLQELRTLRAEGRLMAEGLPVVGQKTKKKNKYY